MKKWSVLAFLSALLMGCGSNDAEDVVVDTIGLNIDGLSNQEKQRYAQVSTDINTVIIYIAGQCFDAESERNPDMELIDFNCNIANYKDSASQAQYTNLSLNSGELVVTRTAKSAFKIQTKDNVKFHAASISDGTLNYRLEDDNAIHFTENEATDTHTVTFRGFFRDDKTLNVAYWTVESISSSPFSYEEDTNNQHSWLAGGSAKLSGKDSKTFDWTTSTTGQVVLPLTE
ncbi:hypothetical protein [Photobacterium leiognathi]|uniref:Lipoprotein n=1 Tax=Photobacterium leiognathi TaxID=553611 RepID=A0ABX5GKQ1_PHOLE|nr:hypothetical protein [Photobacterium leiognathi]KJF91793.1 hypothetical protein UB42_00500 [Photobacterium leiognathi]PSV86436.1 hypothetical protein CTM94_01130 [Photobacterium leiognathi]